MQTNHPHLQIRFWGTRGSHTAVSSQFSIYGNHTSCVEFELPEQILIFDAGTGFQDFSADYLKREDQKPILVFISHMHFDHILGLDHADVMFRGDVAKTIFGQCMKWKNGRAVCSGNFIEAYRQLFSEPYSPNLAKLHDQIGHSWLIDMAPMFGRKIKLANDYKLQLLPIPHGETVSVGAQLRRGKDSWCILNDISLHHTNQSRYNIARFCSGAKIVIADGMYTREDFARNPALSYYGHSAAEDLIDLCAGSKVQELQITHHDPRHDDPALYHREQMLQRYQNDKSYLMKVSLAQPAGLDWSNRPIQQLAAGALVA